MTLMQRQETSAGFWDREGNGAATFSHHANLGTTGLYGSFTENSGSRIPYHSTKPPRDSLPTPEQITSEIVD